MKPLKKTLLATALIALLICAFSLITSAATYGDLTYTVSNGEVTITDFSDSVTSVIIPSEINGYPVKSIGSFAFYGCSSLESIEIPDSVTSIGFSAFYGCSSLASINVDVNNTKYSSDERGVLYNKNKTTLIQYPAGNTATTYEIPSGVTSIDFSAFYGCSSLKSVSFGENSQLTSIDDYAFFECYNLESIEIPDSVTSIGSYAFKYCSSLDTVYYRGSSSDWSDISIGSYNGDLTGATRYYNFKVLITYNANGGTGAPPVQVLTSTTAGSVLTTTIPTRTGHTFLGWSTTADGEVQYNPGDTYTQNEDVTLYAVWEIKTYTISYNTNGGSTAPESQTKTYGTDIELSTVIPEKEGYNFLGWSTSSTATSASYSSGATYYDSGDTDVTLYAVWQLNTYSVIYNANGGSSAPSSQTKSYFDDLVLSATIPTRTGHTFLGWSTTADGEVQYNPGDTYTQNEDVTLYAVWEIKTYTISYNTNGGSTAPEIQTKTYGTVIELSTVIPEKEGYNFLGWSASSTGLIEKSISVEGVESSHNYANNTNKTWTISYSGATSIELTFDSQTKFENNYDYLYIYDGQNNQLGKYSGTTLAGKTITVEDDKVVLKLTSDSSQVYWGFKVTSATATLPYYAAGDSYTENADLQLYAVWQLKTYSVIYNANGGTGAPSSQTKYYFSDLALTTTVPTYTGHTFLGWSTTADGRMEYRSGDTYTQNEAITLYAKWVSDDSIALDGTTQTTAGQTVSYDVYLSSANNLDYLISTVKYPKHFIYEEIINKDFIDNIVDTQYSDDEYNYITIISTYDYDGERTESITGYTPYEIVFTVSETCPIGTYSLAFGDDTIAIGDADYTLAMDGIDVFVSEILTICGDDEILSDAQYTVRGVNTPVVPVIWSVDDENVATISEDGVLTPIVNGTVVITATYTENNSVFATKTVTIKDNDVTGIDIIGSDTVYDVEKYYAKIYPENLNSKKVKWSIDNSEVATITEDGVLTAVSAGTVTVRATVDDAKEFYEEMTVTIPSVNTVIDSLSTDIGTWDKAFVPYERNYTVVVPADTASIAVTGSFTGGSLKCNATTMLNGRARTITLDSDVTTLTLVRANVDGKNDSSYTVTVVRSVTYITANGSVVNGKYHFEVDTVALPKGCESASVVVAVYDENGTFVTMQTKPVTSDDTTASFDFDVDDVYSYQVMLFDALGNMKPLCTSVKDNI